MSTPSVLLTSDGTYPCYQGGVSVWCDQLVRQLSRVDFHVFAISYSPSHPLLFSLPPNVRTCHVLPLWGTDQPGDLAGPPSNRCRYQVATTPGAVRDLFVEPFQKMLRSLANPAPDDLATSLVRLHELFLLYDYTSVMTSPEMWEAFCACSHQVVPEIRITLEDCTQCMRWLQRYLSLLCVEYPVCDVTHASMSGIAAVPGVLQKFRHRTPFVLSEHGIYLRELYLSISRMESSAGCKRFLFNLNNGIVRMNYDFADVVTSLCDFNRRWQLRFGVDSSKITIVPNGIDADRFYPDSSNERFRPVILTMARIYPLKGIIHLVSAARLVLDRVPDARFRILGDVGDADYFKECLQIVSTCGLSHAVEFGRTDDSPRAYREASVFCLPSISEAMPYSVLEAMFSGCPVVASDVGGISEMIDGVGLLVKPGDKKALTEALVSLLDGEEGASRREKLASLALARARSRYSQRQCVGKFEEIYRELSIGDVTTEVSASSFFRPQLVSTA